MVQFEVRAGALSRSLGVYEKALQAQFRVAVRAMLDSFEGKMKQSFAPYRGRSGKRLQARTGNLRGSIRQKRLRDLPGGGVEGAVFTDSIYAKTHEFGATIRPKRKRYLRIPLRDTLTSTGDVRGGLELVNRGGKFQTADGQQTYITGFGNRLYIVARGAGRGGRGKALYRLARSVKIRPRLGFFETWSGLARSRRQLVTKSFRDAAKESLDRG